MRILTILLSVVISIACNQVASQTKKVTSPEKQSLANAVAVKPEAKPFSMPKIESIEKETIWRLSKNKDQHGDYQPPWTEVEVSPYFKIKPVLPGKVTVVPLNVDINSFNWQIAKSERKEFGCDETKPYAWEVKLQLTQKEFFEFVAPSTRRKELPFDVIVLYPAVDFARQIKKEQLTKQMLPKGTAVNVVEVAIDVTNDQKPDILLLEFCCEDTAKSPKTIECDYTCGKTFKKVKGIWKLIDEYSPC